MSELLTHPTQSWRPPRRQSLLDPQIRRMALIAVGAATVLGLGVAATAYIANRPRGVPVIEADTRPLRVKPDNPGGLQVAGTEEQIMGGTGSGAADVMAPVAEMPQPQVLRAQIQAARQPVPTIAAPAPTQPISPVSPPIPPSPTMVATPRVNGPATPLAHGGTEVQLAAMESQQAAMDEWRRLNKRLPDLLSARRPAVTRVDRGGKVFYRLRTGGFGDTAQATAFCTQVKAKGGGCSIASF